MANPLGKGKASPAEQEKLIEEIQGLIKEKGLEEYVRTTKPTGGPHLMGCATCTVCPCMICW
jgi:hypothetical protein